MFELLTGILVSLYRRGSQASEGLHLCRKYLGRYQGRQTWGLVGKWARLSSPGFPSRTRYLPLNLGREEILLKREKKMKGWCCQRDKIKKRTKQKKNPLVLSNSWTLLIFIFRSKYQKGVSYWEIIRFERDHFAKNSPLKALEGLHHHWGLYTSFCSFPPRKEFSQQTPHEQRRVQA